MTRPTAPALDPAADPAALLRRRRQIAQVWGVGDVTAVRPDLSDDQAWAVLVRVDRTQDAAAGITWHTLEAAAAHLFGPAPDTDDLGEDEGGDDGVGGDDRAAAADPPITVRAAATRAAEPDPAPPPTPVARETALTRRLDAHLTDLTSLRPADPTDRAAVQREVGWMEAVRHLAARDGLTHAGRVEAGQLLEASRDWLREQAGAPAAGRGR